MQRRQDLWETCYEGEHRSISSPEKFSQLFCSRCQNAGCTRSLGSRTKWQHRMDTQEDLLLRNPRFAEEDDPRFRDIREQEFKDAIRQALAIEVGNAKGDWSIPTDVEIATMAASVAGFVPPPNLGKPVEPITIPDTPPEIPEVEEWVVQGDQKNQYTVRKTGKDWTCTCSGFLHRRSCKHITDLQRKSTQEIEKPVPSAPPAETGPRRLPDPVSWTQAASQNKIPKASNTTVPKEGIVVGGPVIPEVDPWASPETQKEIVIPVGGRVTLGGGSGRKP